MLHNPERVNIVKCARWVWINILTTYGLACRTFLGDPPLYIQLSFAGWPLPVGPSSSCCTPGSVISFLNFKNKPKFKWWKSFYRRQNHYYQSFSHPLLPLNFCRVFTSIRNTGLSVLMVSWEIYGINHPALHNSTTSEVKGVKVSGNSGDTWAPWWEDSFVSGAQVGILAM